MEKKKFFQKKSFFYKKLQKNPTNLSLDKYGKIMIRKYDSEAINYKLPSDHL